METLADIKDNIGHLLFRLAVSIMTVGGLGHFAYWAIEEGWWDPGTVVSVALEEGRTAHLLVIDKPEGWVTMVPIGAGLAIPVSPGCFAASGAVTPDLEQRTEFTLGCMRQLQRINELAPHRKYYIREIPQP